MTGLHECALQITIAKMVDGGEEEYTGGLREILSLVQRLASGDLRCADTKTEVVRNREDVEGA